MTVAYRGRLDTSVVLGACGRSGGWSDGWAGRTWGGPNEAKLTLVFTLFFQCLLKHSFR